MCFIPSNLDYLRAGGRVSNATAICGNLLGIHPKIELVDGYLRATKKYRGRMGKVLCRLISDFVAENALEREEPVSYTHLDVYKRQGQSAGRSGELKGAALHDHGLAAGGTDIGQGTHGFFQGVHPPSLVKK